MQIWLVLGAIIAAAVFGWGSCETHYHAEKETMKQKHAEALKERDEEIKRLRTQVANLIGVEK